MKLIWRGNWKKGELTIEASSLDELVQTLTKLESEGAIDTAPASTLLTAEMPKVSYSSGPSDAIRGILGSPWGKSEPRTMKEIMDVLKTNAIYFSESSISGILARMTKKGELRRPTKKLGAWAYVLVS